MTQQEKNKYISENILGISTIMDFYDPLHEEENFFYLFRSIQNKPWFKHFVACQIYDPSLYKVETNDYDGLIPEELLDTFELADALIEYFIKKDKHV